MHKPTANSFIDLVKYVFTVPGVSVFFSRKICQDPLVKFFGCQRQISTTHDNINVKEFQQNIQTLRLVNCSRKLVKSNCRGNEDLNSSNLSNSPFPKRPRNSSNEKKMKGMPQLMYKILPLLCNSLIFRVII